MGFPPLPTNGTVRILTVDRKNWKLEYPPPNYDVSFQFCEGSTFYPYSSRFVALKHGDGELKWVSEQMVFDGPKRYTVDGQLASEAITLTCEVEQVAYHGTNIAGTVITYAGPDKRLAPSGDHGEGLSVSQGRSHFAGVGLQIRSGESSTRTLGPRRGHRPLHIL
jgi:hypothetical protein